MAKKRRYSAQEVSDAITKAQGYVSSAASILGCHVTTVYNYIERYDMVKQAVNETREKRHDFVENALMTQIKEGNTTATIFYLKTQAKQRGYVERQEIDHSGGLNIVMDWGDNGDNNNNTA